MYVIRLDSKVATKRRFLAANPDRRLDKPCVYVGMTGRTPEERLEQHLQGYKDSVYVKKFGRALIPWLYVKYNPMTYADAKRMEVALAERLRRRGYGVWQK